jgi:hypothetical protein
MARSRDTSKFEDLEALRQRFQEFRKANRPRTRLPEELWNAAAEIAGRRGMGLAVRTLRLDVNNLKKRMGQPVSQAGRRPGRQKTAATAPAKFVEFVVPAPAAASCVVEVESALGGKLRMELKGLGTSEIAQLLQAFAGR